MSNGLKALTLMIILLATTALGVSPEWKYSQEIDLPGGGLIKIRLPLETLSVSRPGLTDLRIADSEGQEVAYFLDQPVPTAEHWVVLESLSVVMGRGKTVIKAKVSTVAGVNDFDRLSLETPSDQFIKAVTVEGSFDGTRWQVLVRDRPIFRQPGGAKNLTVELPRGHWSYLRITLDDQETAAIPITNARIRIVAEELKDLFQIVPTILESSLDGKNTTLRLQLPAGNIMITSMSLEVEDPIFTRQMVLVSRVVRAGIVEEKLIAEGTIYRVHLRSAQAERPTEQLRVPALAQMRGREAILKISNGDNAPLKVIRVRMEAAPVFVLFYAKPQTKYYVLTGNPNAAAKTYDLSSLKNEMRQTPSRVAKLGFLTTNSAFKEPEAFPGVPERAGGIDVSAWQFRKGILIQAAGIQKLELNLETIAHDENRLVDLRLVRDGSQVPFVLDNMRLLKSFQPQVEPLKSVLPGVTRWALRLPFNQLPVTTVRCASTASLFERRVRLLEDAPGDRGDIETRVLGQTTWRRVLGQPASLLSIDLSMTPRSDKLILEIEDRDNPPLKLADFLCDYQCPRVLFKASPTSNLFLYYGNPDAQMPHYDLDLVAEEILAADALDASLSKEEVLKKSWGVSGPKGPFKYVFWGAIGLVALALLWVIARLLPSGAQDT